MIQSILKNAELNSKVFLRVLPYIFNEQQYFRHHLIRVVIQLLVVEQLTDSSLALVHPTGDRFQICTNLIKVVVECGING